MEIMRELSNFFGLEMEIETFPDFMQWFVMLLFAVIIVAITIKALFTATWKIERSLR